jgi:hypothetical protein
MGVFRQLGDPVCPPCLCQHHGAEYGNLEPLVAAAAHTPNAAAYGPGAIILSVPITTTERCCIVVNAAMIVDCATLISRFDITRPPGTQIGTQEDDILTNELNLTHHAAWETLDAGTYTYNLQRIGAGTFDVYAAWLKVIASDCEG